MKKIRIIALCFILLFGFASLTHAELPNNRIALGVQLGARFEQVKNVFGIPDRVTKNEVKSEAYGDFVETTFIYGNNSIVVKFYDEDAWRIESNSDNGWRTPDGVTVGMSLKDMVARLGKEDIKNPSFDYVKLMDIQEEIDKLEKEYDTKMERYFILLEMKQNYEE